MFLWTAASGQQTALKELDRFNTGIAVVIIKLTIVAHNTGNHQRLQVKIYDSTFAGVFIQMTFKADLQFV